MLVLKRIGKRVLFPRSEWKNARTCHKTWLFCVETESDIILGLNIMRPKVLLNVLFLHLCSERTTRELYDWEGLFHYLFSPFGHNIYFRPHESIHWTFLSDLAFKCMKILWNQSIMCEILLYSLLLSSSKKWKKCGFFPAFFTKIWWPLVTSNWWPHWWPQVGGHQRSPEKKTCDDALPTHPQSGKVQKCPKSSVSTRKLFLTMGNMFLGSEMMFDMIRNYFRVESDDFGFFRWGGENRRRADGYPPPWGGGGYPSAKRRQSSSQISKPKIVQNRSDSTRK